MKLSTLTKAFSTPDLSHLEDAEVPVISGMQRQGDVMVRPSTPGQVAGLVPLTSEGVVVVRGEAGGNTHILRALDGSGVMYAPNPRAEQRCGTLVVPEGAEAFLEHMEHGFNGIGAGTYTVKRSRVLADEIRILAD